jgi:8-amino-7-oxononanoate synthase
MVQVTGLEERLRRRLQDLEARHLLRRSPVLDATSGRTGILDGRRVVRFSSNDYLGLADHPRLVEAASRAREVGATASRLIAGTRSAHLELERRLAARAQQPAALLFSSGYAANVGALAALIGPQDLVLSDRLNHASLIDGLRLSRATVQVYPHRDVSAVERLLEAHRERHEAAWIVTDAYFSMDGTTAPLRALNALAERHEAHLYVDEAHSLGVLGEAAGVASLEGVRPDVVVGTLGKAFGVQGAFVAGTEVLRSFLENRARSFVFSTGVAPLLLGPLGEALAVEAEEGPTRRRRLAANAERLRVGLRALGHRLAPDGVGPIVPVLVGDPRAATRLEGGLLARGFYVRAIRPPTVPEGGSRLRIVVTAAHRPEDIEGLLRAFSELAAVSRETTRPP